MILEHIGLKEINGSLVVLDDVDNASNEEMVELHLDDGSVRAGRIVKIDGKRVVIQVFEGTRGVSSTTSTPKRLLSLLTSTSIWMSPAPETTIWCVSALLTTRKDGSSSFKRLRPWAILSSWPRVLGAMATL